MRRVTGRVILVVLIVAIIVLFIHYNLISYLTLENLKAQQAWLAEKYATHPYSFIGTYLAVYILCTALSIPGATLFTLAGGALFGVWFGTILVSFASTIGATCAFLASRFILRDLIQKKFNERLDKINQGVKREGVFYLFTLRLVPVFPFFLVNLIMGLTSIRVVTFFFVSQLGMLPGTLAYVNAGTQLSKIDSLKGILSPGLLISFAVVGFLPIASKWVIKRLHHVPTSSGGSAPS